MYKFVSQVATLMMGTPSFSRFWQCRLIQRWGKGPSPRRHTNHGPTTKQDWAWVSSVLLSPKMLKWKDGQVYAYPVQNKWAAHGPQCVYAPCLLSTRDAPCDVNFVAGANVVCFVSLLIHRAIHTTLWTSQTSADHEQGAWSVTGTRAHFIVSLLCNAQYGIAYLLSTQNNPYFFKISFSKQIPLIKKILWL